jgi:hypothetical protein
VDGSSFLCNTQALMSLPRVTITLGTSCYLVSSDYRVATELYLHFTVAVFELLVVISSSKIL